MRKNFLILMLLSLLPLAGWATINVTTPPTLNAGGADYSGVGQAVINDDGECEGFGPFTWKYTVTTDGNEPASNATWYTKANMKVTNAGTYYVWYKVESGTSGEAAVGPVAIAGSFKINKKNLTVLFDGASTGIAPIVKNFGEPNPAPAYALTYSGFVNGETSAVISGTLSYTQNSTDANYQPDGTTKKSGYTGDGYAITFKGLSAINYNIVYPTVKMKIKQIALAATPAEIPADGKNYFTYEKVAGSLTYSGSAQTATYNIYYYDAQGTKNTLAVSTGTTGSAVKQYKLTYGYKATAEAETYGAAGNDHTNAGYYRPTITAEATSNYSGSVTIADGSLDFQIAKRDAYVYVNDDSKVYDGQAYDLTYNYQKVTFTQMKGLAASAVTGVTIDYADEIEDDAEKNVNETGYRMIPVVAENSNLRTNHNVHVMNTGRWKITNVLSRSPQRKRPSPMVIPFPHLLPTTLISLLRQMELTRASSTQQEMP